MGVSTNYNLYNVDFQDENVSLYKRNRAILNEGKKLNFETVNTFEMTMSRYEHFFPGQCSCHFHTIKKKLPSFKSDQLIDLIPTFHVEGMINQEYSSMILEKMCQNSKNTK